MFTQGTTDGFPDLDRRFKEGRFFNEMESKGAAQRWSLGYDVAEALFPTGNPLDKMVSDQRAAFRSSASTRSRARSSASSASTRSRSCRCRVHERLQRATRTCA